MVRFGVRLTPRGGRDAVEGVGPSGLLLVRVRAAPVDGAANAALLRLVARTLDVPAGAVSLVAGAGGRRKRLAVTGLRVADVAALWPGLTAVDAPDRATG